MNSEFTNFKALKISLASTEKILSWSHGEVKKPETINYRTLKPEKDGLFCERIFGPTKDWECHCGKYKRIRFKGMVCDRCGVEITKAKVRRERMGHIKLASPVSHIWYFKGIPSRIGLVLDLTPKNLEKVLYFAAYIVTDPGDAADLKYMDILTEDDYRAHRDQHKNKNAFRAGMGAEAILELLRAVDLDKLSADIRNQLVNATAQKKGKLVRRLEVVEALRQSGNKPEWMILEVVPVIPPDIRPMVQLDGGRFATSDLNDLYRRVINRNNRLQKMLSINAPDIIVRNEKRMLQEAVDALIDNGRRGRAVTGPGSRPLKSLSDMLKGKQGRFRQNLLGKRVDYSGRSVIVVGPELKFYQCGLPKKMALELFKPFIMKELVANEYAHNIRSAKRMVEKVNPRVWDVLDEVIKEHPVLLNRAPTLHRLGIQAFEPVLVEGKAIKLHPLVCTAYNADFDGDQMAVHVPLTVEAQAEARFLMLSVNNILAPKDGSPITTPTQDMILGSYYLTHAGETQREEEQVPLDKAEADAQAKGELPIVVKTTGKDDKKGKKKADAGGGATTWWCGVAYKPETVKTPDGGTRIVDGKSFCDYDELVMAYRNGEVTLHAKVRVRRFADENDKVGKLIDSTVGRFIFNEHLPHDLGFIDRGEDPYSLEVDRLCDKKMLGRIIDECFRKHGNTETAIMLDHIKDLGFHYSTVAAVTISIDDMEIPETKEKLIEEAESVVGEYERMYAEGLITEEERYGRVVDAWNKTTDKVADALMDELGELNNLYIMAHSGARGSKSQIRQIGGMRGLMANAAGKTIEIPIKANFREGLSVLEYFISSNGARKGLADTALRTAESGYLTRRLVDVSHNVIVREEDCGSGEGITVSAFVNPGTGEVIEKLAQRIIGRTALKDIVHPETGEVIVRAGEEINEDHARAIEEAGITDVEVRSVLTCHAKKGICAKCYGRNLATGEPVNIGEAVGIQAAQSIGEPGTQLTMRTFHTGGVAAGGDITQGLPRVEELFEARRPGSVAKICEVSGTVLSIDYGSGNSRVITIGPDPETSAKEAAEVETRTYDIPQLGGMIIVKEGDKVEAGDPLTGGPLDPKRVLDVKRAQYVADGYSDDEADDLAAKGVYNYLLKEVQRVYKLQGVDINDKHIEIIVSQMLSKYKVEEPGDTTLLPDKNYTKPEIDAANGALAAGQTPATYRRVLQGITKSSLATESFLSAASFQETTKVLTGAAIEGKTDYLLGLKENVIIGKLIPAGTGMERYNGVAVDYGERTEYMENYVKPKEPVSYLTADGDVDFTAPDEDEDEDLEGDLLDLADEEELLEEASKDA
ncbi:MAG: DNA-directed RNA polymerase subunit beta' [Clostridiales Family XIII bacterium]|jgi:DNA-directed RNA polymerase subunit beta'|nr:DNA-directed RNA polymerase subunit beta' [Clostridiales Family XIII bacterium]